MHRSRNALRRVTTRAPLSPRRSSTQSAEVYRKNTSTAFAMAASVRPAKNGNEPGPPNVFSEASAMATAMDPGPVVIGMVSGKKVVPPSRASAGPSGAGPVAEAWSGMSTRQAVTATTMPPPTRTAPRLTPKKLRMPAPNHSEPISTIDALSATARDKATRSSCERSAVRL